MVEKPRSLPPIPIEIREVDEPIADSWGGVPTPWDLARSSEVAPPQLASVRTKSRARAASDG
jgi:hypothetical protein